MSVIACSFPSPYYLSLSHPYGCLSGISRSNNNKNSTIVNFLFRIAALAPKKTTTKKPHTQSFPSEGLFFTTKAANHFLFEHVTLGDIGGREGVEISVGSFYAGYPLDFKEGKLTNTSLFVSVHLI